MSRSCYTDDGDDYPGQVNLYRGNVQRSIRSKAGQARLRELRDALLALPIKELEAEIFADGTREQPKVCALGAWALAKQGGDPKAAKSMLPMPRYDWEDGLNDEDTAAALAQHGWPKLVVFETVYENDEALWADTPAKRYTHILAWIESQIR